MTTAAENKAIEEGGNRHDKGRVNAVYVMSNQATGNSVMVFRRAADGSLTQTGTFPTGGLGAGTVMDPLDPLLSQGSLVMSADQRFLFAVDAGSDELSVLAVDGEKLVAVDRVPSGGTFPVSVTVYDSLVYVLHRGDVSIGDANVTGFTVDAHGKLTALPDSTQMLVGGPNTVPAQVQFTPNGAQLVVTERTNNLIDVLPVDADGRAGKLVRNESSGRGPFGFTFAGNDVLIVSELGAAATSSYRVNQDGTLTVVSGSVSTAEQGACWAVATGTVPGFAYVANAVSGSVTGYSIDDAGVLTRLSLDGHTAVAFESRAMIDSAVSGDGRFLYVLTGGFSATAEAPVICNEMSISAFRIEASGNLTAVPGPAGLAPGTQGIVAT